MRDTNRPCTHPGCKNKRWFGPKGNNSNLTMCEEHQREYWRNEKRKKPKVSKGALLEDGTRRGPGKPKKNAPKPISENIAPMAPVFDELIELAKQRAQQLSEDCPPKTIKVLVINRKQGIAQYIDVPVLSETPLSSIRRPDDLFRLLRGSGTLVVYADRDKV